MLHSSLVAYSIKNNQILVEGKCDRTVRCVGSSMKTLASKSSAQSFLCICDPTSSKEVLAVTINRGFPSNPITFLVGITRKNRQPYINERKNFISFGSGRYVAIVNHDIVAYIDGKTYSSSPSTTNMEFHVDANTLCAYAAEKITAANVKSVAQQKIKKADDSLQKERARVAAEAAKMAQEAEEHAQLLRSLFADRETLKRTLQKVDKLNAQIELLGEQIHNSNCSKRAWRRKSHTWQKWAEELVEACESHWSDKILFKTIPEEIQDIIDEIKEA